MKKFIAGLMGLSLCGSLSAQTPVTPSTEAGEEKARQERIKLWRDGKFGMFICWGLNIVIWFFGSTGCGRIFAFIVPSSHSEEV